MLLPSRGLSVSILQFPVYVSSLKLTIVFESHLYRLRERPLNFEYEATYSFEPFLSSSIVKANGR